MVLLGVFHSFVGVFHSFEFDFPPKTAGLHVDFPPTTSGLLKTTVLQS